MGCKGFLFSYININKMETIIAFVMDLYNMDEGGINHADLSDATKATDQYDDVNPLVFNISL